MGWAKEQYIADLEFVEEREAACQEDQSRLRLSMICKDMPLTYDLHVCILELAQFVSAQA